MFYESRSCAWDETGGYTPQRKHLIATRVFFFPAPLCYALALSSSFLVVQDQYANYVIQKTLQLAPRDAALTLVESIREHLPLMRNSSGGRRMLTKIAKRFPVNHVSTGNVGVERSVVLGRKKSFVLVHLLRSVCPGGGIGG